ncbi:MAG TPA: hypothetical protein PLB16_08580 [bacterium]|nr:hypothetical protein [bacterium]
MIAFAIFLSWGCEYKAPACTSLSWGEAAQVDKNVVEMKYSAGTRCGNISDYYDIDIEGIVSKIQRMKLAKNSDCTQVNYESGEDEVVECPESVLETIEFGEVVLCKFDTPPDENTDCAVNPLQIYFSSDSDFEDFSWSFNLDKPEEAVEFSGKFENTIIEAAPFALTDLSVNLKVTLNVSNEEKTEIRVSYSVETKE